MAVIRDLERKHERLHRYLGIPGEATHKQLITVCEGFGKYLKVARKRTKPGSKWLPDCSCGCKYYHELSGKAGQDWGVCWNKKSPRAGKLTFEHMERCKLFRQESGI